MNSSKALPAIEKVDTVKNLIIKKRQRAYYNRPFFNGKNKKADKRKRELDKINEIYAAQFTAHIDKLLKQYKNACVDVLTGSKLYKPKSSIQKNKWLKTVMKRLIKAKRYTTEEYLDERYNRVIVDDITDALETMRKGFGESLQKSYDKYIAKGNIKDSAELIYRDVGIDINFNKFNERTSKHVKDKAINWAKQVSEDTEKIIKKELVKGYEAGESSYETARRIRENTGFSYARAEAIARTEINLSRNYTQYQASMDFDEVIGHKWDAANDERTRPTHTEAHGQIRKKGEPFNIGGYKMLYPMDGSFGAPAREIINCRCVLEDVFNGEELESHTVYDEKDVGTDEWLRRQPEAFQLDYWGGKAKKELGDAGLLELEHRGKTLEEIILSLENQLEDVRLSFDKDKNEFVITNNKFGLKPLDLYDTLESLNAIVPENERAELVKRLGNSRDIEKKILEYKISKAVFVYSKGKSRYDAKKKEIFYNVERDLKNQRGKFSTIIHEMAHMIDYQYGYNPSASTHKKYKSKLHSALKIDAKKYLQNVADYLEGNLKRKPTETELQEEVSERLKDISYAAPSDLLGGLTKNKYIGSGFHKKDYWETSPNHILYETFAHFFEANAGASKEKRENLYTIFPNTGKAYDGIIKDMRRKLIWMKLKEMLSGGA